jgi:hypothetical protein
MTTRLWVWLLALPCIGCKAGELGSGTSAAPTSAADRLAQMRQEFFGFDEVPDSTLIAEHIQQVFADYDFPDEDGH